MYLRRNSGVEPSIASFQRNRRLRYRESDGKDAHCNKMSALTKLSHRKSMRTFLTTRGDTEIKLHTRQKMDIRHQKSAIEFAPSNTSVSSDASQQTGRCSDRFSRRSSAIWNEKSVLFLKREISVV